MENGRNKVWTAKAFKMSTGTLNKILWDPPGLCGKRTKQDLPTAAQLAHEQIHFGKDTETLHVKSEEPELGADTNGYELLTP